MQNGIEFKRVRRAIDAAGLHSEVDIQRLCDVAGLAGEGDYRAEVARREPRSIGKYTEFGLTGRGNRSRAMIERQPGSFPRIPGCRPVDATRTRGTQHHRN